MKERIIEFIINSDSRVDVIDISHGTGISIADCYKLLDEMQQSNLIIRRYAVMQAYYTVNL
jgi:hypothetical protein